LTAGAVPISVLLNMTAEIAIINRSAVTLAADSAVTLTVRGERRKHYFDPSLNHRYLNRSWDQLDRGELR